MTPRERYDRYFLPKFLPDDETGCWDWLAAKTKAGYGVFGVDGHRTTSAHRFAYEVLAGPIPDGYEVDHICSNRACVNPAHLEPVTHTHNIWRKTGCSETHCSKGHELTGDNLRLYVRPNGGVWRRCRECRRQWSRARYHNLDMQQ